MHTNISCHKIFNGEICKVSSELNASKIVGQLLSEKGGWCSQKKSSLQEEYIILDYKDIISINFVKIENSLTNNACFPQDFRLECSTNGKQWQVIHIERNCSINEAAFEIKTDLLSLRFLKLFINKPQQKNNKYYVEIGNISIGICDIEAKSTRKPATFENNTDKLFDNSAATYWETEPKEKTDRTTLDLDLGKNYILSHIEITSSSLNPNGFPEKFTIETSIDKKIWIPLVKEKFFCAENDQHYMWSLESNNARFIKLEMDDVQLKNNTYGLRISGINVYASTVESNHAHSNSGNPLHASIFQSGIVKLSKDGETEAGTVIQANDRRLKEGSTIFKGIVQFAENEGSTPGLAVQASDDRLKPATELREGIVRLAHDRENKGGAVVQSNDSRLHEATDSSYGIVKLCKDGFPSEKGVVLGNDSRLKEATTSNMGISRFAENEETTPGTCVQANDSRLKHATTTSYGIIELADDGEDTEGVVVQGNDKRLKDATTTTKGIVELAEDGEDTEGVVIQGNDKRLKDATTGSKGIVELAENGEDKEGVVVQGNDDRLRNASLTQPGIMRFADNNEESPFAAVQGNDQRLKEATTTSRGIIELAEDGEEKEGVVVQGNDKRLKEATTATKGIVELADNGEDKEGVVVQGNDHRLKDATTSSKGIIELAENGEDKSGVAVQGNDDRLKNATTSTKGIVILAEDGDTSGGVAVQGDDKRLKDASETNKGIVQLAPNGTTKPETVIQADDNRLKEATTTTSGIIELAEDGEDAEGVVVQGNDKRLKQATDNSYGISVYAKDGESKSLAAVQSNDSRLFDAREPLPHEHDYADTIHDFNSHSGTIEIEANKSEKFQGVTPPPSSGSVIHAKNKSKSPGSIAIAGVTEDDTKNPLNSYGILGHSPFIGVRGQASGKEHSPAKDTGCGILGISRFGAGGVFSSEHDYSLVVDGFGEIDKYDSSLKMIGNGKALSVNGDSDFNGKISITTTKPANQDEQYPANIIEMFEVDDVDYISPGDLLIASPAGDSKLGRTHSAYHKSVIGVVSGNPAIILNNSNKESKIYPITLAGKVMCKVDARNTPIMAGDLIVTSETPGCGMKGVIDSFDKIGTVIGKALDNLENGIGVIPIFICHA